MAQAKQSNQAARQPTAKWREVREQERKAQLCGDLLRRAPTCVAEAGPNEPAPAPTSTGLQRRHREERAPG